MDGAFVVLKFDGGFGYDGFEKMKGWGADVGGVRYRGLLVYHRL